MNPLKQSRGICLAVFFFAIIAYPLWAEPDGVHLARVVIATAFTGWAVFDLAIFLELKDKENE